MLSLSMHTSSCSLSAAKYPGLLAGLLGAALMPMVCGAAEPGPVVAIRDFTPPNEQAHLGKGLSDMLVTDLSGTREPCELTVVVWGKDREAVLDEQALQQSPNFDPATRAPTGKLLQPDVFVDGSVTVADGKVSWSARVSDANTGEVLAEREGSAPADQFFEGEQALAQELAADLCKARPGFVLKGKMDEATVTGLVCGDLSKPFTAFSPEVAGTWTFTPTDKASGSFVYTASNVGGVPGKGSGTYKILPGTGGARRIQLKGSGSIISPVGTFSAPITESLTLTPTPSCKRTGNR